MYKDKRYRETETPQEGKDVIKRLGDDERTLISIEGAGNGLPVNTVKTVTLAVEDVAAHPEARAVLRQFLTAVESAQEVGHGR